MTAKKSYRKRIKVTKTGKLLRRKQGLGHSRANKPRKVMLRKKNPQRISKVDRKEIALVLGESTKQENNHAKS